MGKHAREWTRELQALDPGSTLTMGQWLCVPFLVAAGWAVGSRRRRARADG